MWGAKMSLVRHFRKSNHALVSFRAIACVAALSVFLVRSAPPSLPHIYLGTSLNSTTHNERQQFDHKNSQWATPLVTTLITPLPVTAPDPIPVAVPFVEVATGGWHYNRPPPLG
jgi:hypothetical protein